MNREVQSTYIYLFNRRRCRDVPSPRTFAAIPKTQDVPFIYPSNSNSSHQQDHPRLTITPVIRHLLAGFIAVVATKIIEATMRPSNTNSNPSILLSLLVFTLLVLAFTTTPVDAVNPLWTSFYCRQQCNAAFQMCLAMSGESHRLSCHLNTSKLVPVTYHIQHSHPSVFYGWDSSNRFL